MSLEKRLEGVVDGLSPEQKAKLVIEDLFRPAPALSPSNVNKLLAHLSPDEGRRYNAVVDRYNRLKLNAKSLSHLVNEVVKHLRMRDRIFWYERGLLELEEAIVFDPRVAGPLLIDNPNLKPGKPLSMRVSLATFSVGVWGKDRSPVGKAAGVRLSDPIVEVLDLHLKRARLVAADVKAVTRFLIEESRALDLDFMEGLVAVIVDQAATYDRPLLEDVLDGRGTGWERQSIFPIEKRWALVWEEIDETAETARRIREEPEEWLPVSMEEEVSEVSRHFLELTKKQAGRSAGQT